VIPADLNALLVMTARHIAEFASQLGNEATAAVYDLRASDLAAAVDELMWCKESGCWHDLVLLTPRDPSAVEAPVSDHVGHRGHGGVGADDTRPPPSASPAPAAVPVWFAEQHRRTYASNWVPLWCRCCEPGSSRSQAAVRGLLSSGLVGVAGKHLS